jgi:hypothetical protein
MQGSGEEGAVLEERVKSWDYDVLRRKGVVEGQGSVAWYRPVSDEEDILWVGKGDDSYKLHWYSGRAVHINFAREERIGVIGEMVLGFTTGAIEWRFRSAVRAQYVHIQCSL